MARGLLFSQMQPPPALEGEFNAWYDEEHVPLRLAIDGFEDAVRYRVHPEEPHRDEVPRYAAAYWLRDMGTLESEEYRRLKAIPSERTQRMLRSVTRFTRFACLELSSIVRSNATVEAAPVLYAVWFSVPAASAADLEAWYREEHIPLLMEEPRWRGAVSYRIAAGDPPHLTHLTLHHLESAEALKSPARQRARETSWRERLSQEPWFKGLYILYERIGGSTAGPAGDSPLRSAAGAAEMSRVNGRGTYGGARLL